MIKTAGELRKILYGVPDDSQIVIHWFHKIADEESRIDDAKPCEFLGATVLDLTVTVFEKTTCAGCGQYSNNCVCAEYWKDEEDE